jgi:hypothetical protein
MITTPEPNFEERRRVVGNDRAAYELMTWQDDQRQASVDNLLERYRAETI